MPPFGLPLFLLSNSRRSSGRQFTALRHYLSGPTDKLPAGHARWRLIRSWLFCGWALAVSAAAVMSADSDQPSTDYHLRINCGGPEVTDAKGDVWLSDKSFALGGQAFSFPADKTTEGIESPAPREVYQSVRHQDHALMIRDIPAGHYMVHIHLLDGFANAGRRMDFHAQGKLALDDVNPYEIAGNEINRVVIRSFPVTVEAGKGLRIDCLKDRGDDVFEAALEVVADEAPPTPAFTSSTKGDKMSGADQRQRTSRIHAVTSGRPTRLVWVQTAKPTDFMVREAGEVQLRGYDSSHDGESDRLLLDGEQPIQKPMFSHGGDRVVFSDPAAGTCHVLDWDGGNVRSLGSGFAAEVWKDPETGIDWVFVAERTVDDQLTYVRRQLDAPQQQETVWTGLPAGGQIPWLQLSADGNRAAEAFPWPKCGVLNLNSPAFDWNLIGNGCWPGIAPDNSYRFFLFQGNHTTISMVEDGERSSQVVAINTIPDLEGARVYHPRWSNDARFLTVTGPQKSADTELYLGRFSDDFSHIEAWVRVTMNDRADFYGDAWITPAG